MSVCAHVVHEVVVAAARQANSVFAATIAIRNVAIRARITKLFRGPLESAALAKYIGMKCEANDAS